MEITLSTARQILRQTLGFECFTARFIERVKEDPDCQTASINKQGTLRYNPDFVIKHVKTKGDLFSLIFHETLHKVFGHFIYNSGEIENIAADAIINAVISNIYSISSHRGELFKNLYPPKGLTGILRPDSNMYNSRYSCVYQNLYKTNYGHSSSRSLTTGELIQSLKILIDVENVPVILLIGSHGQAGKDEFPAEITSKLAADIRSALGRNDSQAGYFESLEQLFIEVIKSRLSLPRKILEKYTTNRKIDRFKELYNRQARTTSPIPIYPSKRDLTLIACGIWPAHFHNQQMKLYERKKGIAIYLDVSGSVNEYLPEIIGVIMKLQNKLSTVFLFSNAVVETPVKKLILGQIETTYGTDFDCIAQSIIENQYDKTVVITDGYASLSDDLSEKIKKQKVKILTILFNGKDDCPEFEHFGEIVQLDDLH